MVSNQNFRKIALQLPDVIELPHFERASFRVNKKIFATLLERESLAMVRLAPVDQSVFCDLSQKAMYPVPGGWGRQGATYIMLKSISLNILKDAMLTAYEGMAGKKKSSPGMPATKKIK